MKKKGTYETLLTGAITFDELNALPQPRKSEVSSRNTTLIESASRHFADRCWLLIFGLNGLPHTE